MFILDANTGKKERSIYEDTPIEKHFISKGKYLLLAIIVSEKYIK